jgi:hypothetical protein
MSLPSGQPTMRPLQPTTESARLRYVPPQIRTDAHRLSGPEATQQPLRILSALQHPGRTRLHVRRAAQLDPQSRRQGPPLPATKLPQAASSNNSPNIGSGTASTGFTKDRPENGVSGLIAEPGVRRERCRDERDTRGCDQRSRPEPTAEQKAAEERVRRAQEQGRDRPLVIRQPAGAGPWRRRRCGCRRPDGKRRSPGACGRSPPRRP